MNQPLNDIFGNCDSSGKIGKWAMELSEHVIDFEKRSVIKSQVLADFLVDWMELSSYTEGHSLTHRGKYTVMESGKFLEQGPQ
jgi:hypothetical protein